MTRSFRRSSLPGAPLGIAITSLVLVAALVPACREKRHNQPKPPAAPAAGDPVARMMAQHRVDQWYGMYVSGKKVGYDRIELRPTRGDEPGGYLHRLEMVMDVEGDRLETIDERFYQRVPPYRLMEIRFTERTGAGVAFHRYLRRGDQMVVQATVDGVPQPERTIPASAETAQDLISQYPDPDTVAVGQRLPYVWFYPGEEQDKHDLITVTALRTEVIDGVKTPVAVVEDRVLGQQLVGELRIASGGVQLSSLFGTTNMLAEEEAVAKSQIVGTHDAVFTPPIDRDLGDPSDVDQLALVVGVDPSFEPLDSPNQRVVRRPDGRFDVVIRSVPGAEATAEERTAALAVTAEVDWNTPAIQQRAARIVAGAENDREKVTRLIVWVYFMLDKKLDTNLATASQVLEKRAGNCTEHALLFAALARAAGIPARQVAGVVYVGDDQHRFGWHAWDEVVLDGRWVEVDPTFGQSIADATHLRLGVEGHDDSVMATGTLVIEVKPPE